MLENLLEYISVVGNRIEGGRYPGVIVVLETGTVWQLFFFVVHFVRILFRFLFILRPGRKSSGIFLLVNLKDFIRTRLPFARAEYMLYIVMEDDFLLNKHVTYLVMLYGIFSEYLLSAFILFGYDALDFLVDYPCRFLGIGFGEAVFLTGGVIVIEVGESVAHSVNQHKRTCNLRTTFKIVAGTSANLPHKDILCGTAAE